METRLTRRRHQAGDLVNKIGPISGHVIKCIFNGTDTKLQARETRMLSTGVHVRVNVPAIIFATHFTADSERDHDWRGLKSQHTAFYSTEIQNIQVAVTNTSDRVQSTNTDPFSIYVYALPLKVVTISGLHVYRPSSEKKTRSSIPEADVIVQRVASHWSVRMTVTQLIWTSNRNDDTEQRHSSCFILDPHGIPFEDFDSVTDLVCSDEAVILTKVQALTSEKKLRIYLECPKEEDQLPTRLFCHLLLENKNPDIIMNRNPKPFLRPYGTNGFVIMAPRNIIVKPGKTSHVCLDMTFRCLGIDYIGLIVPKSLPNLSISSNFLRSSQHLFLEIQTTGETAVEIPKGEDIAALHFFESHIFLHKNDQFYTFTGQYDVECKLEYDHVWDDIQDAIHTSAVSAVTGPEDSGDESDDPFKSATTGEKPRHDSDEDNSDEEDTGASKNAVLTWPCWKAGTYTCHLPPLIARAYGPNLKKHDFYWSENPTYRIFFGLSGEWGPPISGKRRRPTAESSSLTVVPSTSKKRHRF
ncbi:tegument protein pp65 [Saimiriine betaherpesvirus 4]|uniref:Tegument protein pp65 n=1 Tax=Saimiriine betaherpesvirus 4 TaxID=1535247 RepID=G8XSY8_9BETA|nr:tegument protein pp65 [Saimiriine betaherpesvirus 4]AEV80934.1 tegument protein pp65 [Saimiriine betaherpesvirus 4]